MLHQLAICKMRKQRIVKGLKKTVRHTLLTQPQQVDFISDNTCVSYSVAFHVVHKISMCNKET